MQAWWRVLRGVYPYRFMVMVSMICALGVGLSYASGVTVMYPVMKIFISEEGMQGWANRTAAQSRLNITLWDFDFTVQHSEAGLVVSDTTNDTPAGLRLDTKTDERGYLVITQVDGVGVNGKPEQVNDVWHQMASTLAHAAKNAPMTLTVRSSNHDAKDSRTVDIKALPDPSFHAALLVRASDMLPLDRTEALLAMVIFFIVLCIVGSIFRYYQQFIGMYVANRVILDLRRRTYNRIVQLPTSFFAQRGTSDAMSRLTQDAGTLTDGVQMAFGKAVQEPVKAAGALGAALWLDWRLTLMMLLSIPALGILISKFSKHMRKASRRALENSSSMLAIINETLIGSRVVKAYSAEGYERRRYSQAGKKLLKQQMKLVHYNSLSRPTVETLAVILTSIPMMIAAHWVLDHKVDTWSFLTLLVLFGAMLEPMRKLADVNAKVQQTNAAATRVFEIIDMDIEPNTSHSLPKLPRHSQSIEFQDITFSYPGHNEIVLDHVSFNVSAGQNVAIVGGNGSGKTTFVQLLPRLYTATSGRILIDGIDASTVSLRSLRKQIGLVTQDTLLFADTIYNNIAYGTRHASREQIMDASRRSFADDFIKNLPEGYQTRVGEHGVRLSGGQKQRIAIARAILHDPSILILDEAMSQIDSDSEQKITLALREFTKGRTTFMIAHRFQSVISADMIVCLDFGQVVGIGTHAQLLATCLAYRKLYENQFRGDAA